MRSFLAAVALLATTASAGTLNFNNWCSVPVYIYRSSGGTCNQGPNGICQGKPGAAPYVLPSGTITRLDWVRDSGTSLKISKNDASFNSGLLQFEYTWASNSGIFWDLSDLDGRGPGLVGTPFRNDNVKISPTGNGSGQGTCVKIRCGAGKVCLDSYQHPDDPNTRWCPLDTGDMWVDLCQPEREFNTRKAKREVAFRG
ncbi:hypothetical protein OQA88_9895 [Cercophora sp. LCS_1]